MTFTLRAPNMREFKSKDDVRPCPQVVMPLYNEQAIVAEVIRTLLARIADEENRFGFEPEVTDQVARPGRAHLRGAHLLLRPYLRRGQNSGPTDAVRAVWCILKYSLKPLA
mgnify:CR=1 FL=1